MQGGHAVGERVDTPKPIGDFGCQCVRQRFHFRDGVPRDADVEKQVEGHGENVHPSDGKGHTVSEPSVVKISKIEDRHIANEHETSDVEMRECAG